jgi:hypothetical protein
MGYKRLMFQRHRAYEPQSDAVWNLADDIRVMHQQEAEAQYNNEENSE